MCEPAKFSAQLYRHSVLGIPQLVEQLMCHLSQRVASLLERPQL